MMNIKLEVYVEQKHLLAGECDDDCNNPLVNAIRDAFLESNHVPPDEKVSCFCDADMIYLRHYGAAEHLDKPRPVLKGWQVVMPASGSDFLNEFNRGHGPGELHLTLDFKEVIPTWK